MNLVTHLVSEFVKRDAMNDGGIGIYLYRWNKDYAIGGLEMSMRLRWFIANEIDRNLDEDD